MTKSLDVTFLKDSLLLNDPNLFIADTGATSNSPPQDFGVIYVKEASVSDAIIDESGNQMKATQTGDINCTICN